MPETGTTGGMVRRILAELHDIALGIMAIANMQTLKLPFALRLVESTAKRPCRSTCIGNACDRKNKLYGCVLANFRWHGNKDGSSKLGRNGNDDQLKGRGLEHDMVWRSGQAARGTRHAFFAHPL